MVDRSWRPMAPYLTISITHLNLEREGERERGKFNEAINLSIIAEDFHVKCY